MKWNAVSGATAYAVHRKADGETGWTRLTKTFTGTAYTDTSVTGSVTYTYRAKALVTGEWSGYDKTVVSATAK